MSGEGRRKAGEHARGRARELAGRTVVLGVVAMSVIGVSWGFLGFGSWAAVGIEIVVISVLAVADRAVGPRFDSWLRGAGGERRIGEVLAGLEAEGWSALHDISLGDGANVDHVAVGPGGVFAIETKSHHGRIGIGRIEEWMLRQAYAEAKRIERITGMAVEPLLVFSDAWLIGRMPARRRGVTVVSGRMLAGYLRRRRTSMSAEEARAACERLAEAVGQGRAQERPALR